MAEDTNDWEYTQWEGGYSGAGKSAVWSNNNIEGGIFRRKVFKDGYAKRFGPWNRVHVDDDNDEPEDLYEGYIYVSGYLNKGTSRKLKHYTCDIYYDIDSELFYSKAFAASAWTLSDSIVSRRISTDRSEEGGMVGQAFVDQDWDNSIYGGINWVRNDDRTGEQIKDKTDWSFRNANSFSHDHVVMRPACGVGSTIIRFEYQSSKKHSFDTESIFQRDEKYYSKLYKDLYQKKYNLFIDENLHKYYLNDNASSYIYTQGLRHYELKDDEFVDDNYMLDNCDDGYSRNGYTDSLDEYEHRWFVSKSFFTPSFIDINKMLGGENFPISKALRAAEPEESFEDSFLSQKCVLSEFTAYKEVLTNSSYSVDPCLYNDNKYFLSPENFNAMTTPLYIPLHYKTDCDITSYQYDYRIVLNSFSYDSSAVKFNYFISSFGVRYDKSFEYIPDLDIYKKNNVIYADSPMYSIYNGFIFSILYDSFSFFDNHDTPIYEKKVESFGKKRFVEQASGEITTEYEKFSDTFFNTRDTLISKAKNNTYSYTKPREGLTFQNNVFYHPQRLKMCVANMVYFTDVRTSMENIYSDTTSRSYSTFYNTLYVSTYSWSTDEINSKGQYVIVFKQENMPRLIGLTLKVEDGYNIIEVCKNKTINEENEETEEYSIDTPLYYQVMYPIEVNVIKNNTLYDNINLTPFSAGLLNKNFIEDNKTLRLCSPTAYSNSVAGTRADPFYPPFYLNGLSEEANTFIDDLIKNNKLPYKKSFIRTYKSAPPAPHNYTDLPFDNYLYYENADGLLQYEEDYISRKIKAGIEQNPGCEKDIFEHFNFLSNTVSYQQDVLKNDTVASSFPIILDDQYASTFLVHDGQYSSFESEYNRLETLSVCSLPLKSQKNDKCFYSVTQKLAFPTQSGSSTQIHYPYLHPWTSNIATYNGMCPESHKNINFIFLKEWPADFVYYEFGSMITPWSPIVVQASFINRFYTRGTPYTNYLLDGFYLHTKNEENFIQLTAWVSDESEGFAGKKVKINQNYQGVSNGYSYTGFSLSCDTLLFTILDKKNYQYLEYKNIFSKNETENKGIFPLIRSLWQPREDEIYDENKKEIKHENTYAFFSIETQCLIGPPGYAFSLGASFIPEGYNDSSYQSKGLMISILDNAKNLNNYFISEETGFFNYFSKQGEKRNDYEAKRAYDDFPQNYACKSGYYWSFEECFNYQQMAGLYTFETQMAGKMSFSANLNGDVSLLVMLVYDINKWPSTEKDEKIRESYNTNYYKEYYLYKISQHYYKHPTIKESEKYSFKSAILAVDLSGAAPNILYGFKDFTMRDVLYPIKTSSSALDGFGFARDSMTNKVYRGILVSNSFSTHGSVNLDKFIPRYSYDEKSSTIKELEITRGIVRVVRTREFTWFEPKKDKNGNQETSGESKVFLEHRDTIIECSVSYTQDENEQVDLFYTGTKTILLRFYRADNKTDKYKNPKTGDIIETCVGDVIVENMKIPKTICWLKDISSKEQRLAGNRTMKQYVLNLEAVGIFDTAPITKKFTKAADEKSEKLDKFAQFEILTIPLMADDGLTYLAVSKNAKDWWVTGKIKKGFLSHTASIERLSKEEKEEREKEKDKS